MKIAKYNIPKDNNNSGERTPGSASQLYGTGANSQVTVADSAKQLAETHSIWGQPFNGTQDVAGDIVNAQNITNEGDINVKSYTDDSGEHGGNIIAENDITAKNFIGEKAELTDQIIAPTGQIDSISGSNLEYDYAGIKELLSQDITTKNLTVTGTAHFFELIIDKIKAAGGAVILSPADGFKVEIVQKKNRSPDVYNLYWKANDGDRAISNMWKAGDQAICRSFNQAAVGTSYNVSNKYYWCRVSGTGKETINGQDYHFIQLIGNHTTIQYAGYLNPEVGDEIAMLGSIATKSDGSVDTERQSAIYISAYSSMDQGLKAPFIAQYTGINDFNLENHRYTWFAHNGNEIRGNFKVSNGKTVEDFVSETIHADLSSYHLVPVFEIAEIRNSDLYIDFEYKICNGPDVMSWDEWINKGLYVMLTEAESGNSEPFSNDGEYPYYYNETYIQQWGNNRGEEPDRFYVDLCDNNGNILERRVIPVIYTAIAQLNITDKIEAKVQGNTGRIAKLELTADQILMKVDEVSLKIDNKNITLDGDTEINGNLNINNSDTGFTLQGADGNTQISPKSIGTFDQFSVTSNITDTVNKHISTSMSNPDAYTFNPDGSVDRTKTRNYTLMYEMQISLGSLKKDDYVEFKNQTLSFSAVDGNGMSSGIKQYKVYKGTTLITSFQTYQHDQTSIGSFTATSNGEYTLKVTINFNCSREAPTQQTDPTKPSTDYYFANMPFTADYSLQVIRPTGDAHMLIGYDGIAANFGNNKTVYIGKNETTIKYGNYGLSITSSGIKKYNGSSWVTADI